jgi:hypothetical protein
MFEILIIIIIIIIIFIIPKEICFTIVHFTKYSNIQTNDIHPFSNRSHIKH